MDRLIDKFSDSTTRWVMLITCAGMGLSLLFHILIPKKLGISETADALIASLKVVLLFDIIVREGAKFSLVPLFIHEEKSRNRSDLQSFTNGIITLAICVGLVLMLLIVVLATWIAAGLLPSKAMASREEMVSTLRICSPLLIFGCGSTILGAFLNSQKKFNVVALRNALPPGLAISVFIFYPGVHNLVQYVAVAYASGFFLYFVWLSIGYYRTGYKYRFRWITPETLRTLKNTISLPTLGFAIRQMTARILVEVLLVGRIGKGSITLYNCAFRIFSAIQTLIGISIATTGLPDMATDSIEDNKVALTHTLKQNIRSVIYIAAPITLIILLFTTRISHLLYGGNKFDEQSIQQIAQLLFWLGTGIIFSCLIPVLNAGLYAQKEFGLIFRNMVTIAVLNFALGCVLVLVLGLNGIALTVGIAAIFAAANLTYLLRKTGIVFSKQ